MSKGACNTDNSNHHENNDDSRNGGLNFSLGNLFNWKIEGEHHSEGHYNGAQLLNVHAGVDHGLSVGAHVAGLGVDLNLGHGEHGHEENHGGRHGHDGDREHDSQLIDVHANVDHGLSIGAHVAGIGFDLNIGFGGHGHEHGNNHHHGGGNPGYPGDNSENSDNGGVDASVNGAPVIGEALTGEVSEDAGLQTIDLLVNAYDPDGDAINVENLTVKDDLGNDVAYTDIGNGEISIDPSQYADLNDGETRTITATYDVVDASGAATSTTAEFIVNGVGTDIGDDGDDASTNAAPVIDVDGSTLFGDVYEIAAGAEGAGTADITAEGKISISDADATSIEGFSLTVEPNGDDYYGDFVAVLADDGSVEWKFTINDSVLDPLDEGDTGSQSYNITVDDGQGGSVTETVTINAYGASEDGSAPSSDGTITGTACIDVLDGTNGDDVIDALSSDDQINGTTGNDIIDGGEGFDHVQYPGTVDDFTFNLQDDGTIVVMKPDGSIDTLANIEAINFTDEGAWYGMDDLTTSHNGDDGAKAGDLTDGVITGTVYGDHLMGTEGDDLINLLGGNDAVDASAGNDMIDGGDGFDHVEYPGTVDDYTFVENEDGTVTVTKPEGVDTLDNIEAVFFTGDNSWYGMDDLTSNHNGDVAGTDDTAACSDDEDGGASTEDTTSAAGDETTTDTTSDGSSEDATDDTGADDDASTVVTSPTVNTIDGLECVDFIAGTDGDDLINLNDGNDGAMGSAGNDTINGGGGYDFVRYDGSADDYTFYTNTDGNITVIKPEGTDILIDVESVIFNDEQVWHNVNDVLDTHHVPEAQAEMA